MIDCCLTPNEHFFQLYHGENKLQMYIQWNDDLFVLDQHAQLDLYSANLLKQQSVVDTSLNSSFRANHSLLLLLNQVNATCLVEKQKNQIYKSLVLSDRGSNTPDLLHSRRDRGSNTPDLLHSRRASEPLHRCGCDYLILILIKLHDQTLSIVYWSQLLLRRPSSF